MKDEVAAAHCAALVRERDRPRFVASLFAPEEVRRKLTALYALDAELQRVREAAHEAMIQAMRFQWWRDALAGLPAATRGHPVLQEVARIGEGAALQAVVDAREGGQEPAVAEALVVAVAARLCGAAVGENAVADFVGAAIVMRDRSMLAEARGRWRVERKARRGELPTYLPATVADMRHPVSELRLYVRMLLMGLRNRF